MKQFKVLFIYPNTPLLNPPPVSIGTFAALLKNENVQVKVFDITYYTSVQSSDKAKEENLQVRPFQYDESKLPISAKDPVFDFLDLVENYKPDLIALSVLEATWEMGSKLLDAIEGIDTPVLVGGLFATFAPEIVLSHPAVSMICIGEGEYPIVELCRRLRQGLDHSNINNLWIKKGKEIIKSPIQRVVDINKLPIPDFSVFHPARLLRPMAGRVYRTIPVETNRGCPYHCTFCNSPTTAKLYKAAGAGKFFRKKSMKNIQKELRYLIKKWDAEYCYFLSDTFLIMSNEEFDAFVEIYSEFKLPFWIQSRADSITPWRANKLKEIGCHRISIGLEHGNEEFRLKILKKKFKNEQMIEAAKILEDVNIPLTVNNIIGFPDETRELVFDTIELNRQLPHDTCNAYVFTPFHGTPLHEYSVKKGYISKENFTGCVTIDMPLDMPQLSREELDGLRKTFALYAKMPREYWPEIKKAEKDDESGRKTFAKLRKIYMNKFF